MGSELTGWANINGEFGRQLALTRGADYVRPIVKRPAVNVEESIERVVGRRQPAQNALASTASTKADSVAWQKALGGVRIPRGVYRFKTHEEADQWLWRMIARPTT